MLGKYKQAEVVLPGGCNIGSRPIDQHIKGWEALGTKVDIANGLISARAEALKGKMGWSYSHFHGTSWPGGTHRSFGCAPSPSPSYVIS